MFPYDIKVEVWENSNQRGNTSHFNFSYFQTTTGVSRTVWKHGKYFPLARREVPAEGLRARVLISTGV